MDMIKNDPHIVQMKIRKKNWQAAKVKTLEETGVKVAKRPEEIAKLLK